MDHFSKIRDNLRHHDIVDIKIDYKDSRMLKILEDIFEYSICKTGFFLNKFPIFSNLNIITEINKKNIIFYINNNKNEIFGISCIKFNNDYLHIDPYNWKKIAKNKKYIYLKTQINNKIEIVKFQETNSIKELYRINNLFNEKQVKNILD